MKALSISAFYAIFFATNLYAQEFQKECIGTSNGYSQLVTITSGNVKTFYVSGQIGDGNDFESQVRSAFLKIQEQLKGTGATLKDVVKMNTYIVEYKPESLAVFRKVRKEILGDSDMPASTLVGVQALAMPGWLVEIEAIAVIEIKN